MVKKSKGLPFTYNITMLPDGTSGNEIVVSRRSKAITRATVDIAYQKVSQKNHRDQTIGSVQCIITVCYLQENRCDW